MTLSDWLQKHDVTFSAFAERIGVSRQAVYRYAQGDRLPRRDVLLRCHEAGIDLREADLDVQPDDLVAPVHA